MPLSRKSLSCSECKAIRKALTSRKSSLINCPFALMAPLAFLFNPHPLLPRSFPLPSSSVPTFSLACPHLMLPPSTPPPSLRSPLLSPLPFPPCFPHPHPHQFHPELCHRIGKASSVASPSAASPKRCHAELPAVLSHFALLWSGSAQMNPRPRLGSPGHQDLECYFPAQPPGNKLMSYPNDKNKRNVGKRPVQVGPAVRSETSHQPAHQLLRAGLIRGPCSPRGNLLKWKKLIFSPFSVLRNSSFRLW